MSNKNEICDIIIQTMRLLINKHAYYLNMPIN